jgi:hypothetical protein
LLFNSGTKSKGCNIAEIALCIKLYAISHQPLNRERERERNGGVVGAEEVEGIDTAG